METREKNIKILCSIYIKVVFTKKGKCGKITVCHFPKLILKKKSSHNSKSILWFPTAKLLNCRPEEKQAARKKDG